MQCNSVIVNWLKLAIITLLFLLLLFVCFFVLGLLLGLESDFEQTIRAVKSVVDGV